MSLVVHCIIFELVLIILLYSVRGGKKNDQDVKYHNSSDRKGFRFIGVNVNNISSDILDPPRPLNVNEVSLSM